MPPTLSGTIYFENKIQNKQLRSIFVNFYLLCISIFCHCLSNANHLTKFILCVFRQMIVKCLFIVRFTKFDVLEKVEKVYYYLVITIILICNVNDMSRKLQTMTAE